VKDYVGAIDQDTSIGSWSLTIARIVAVAQKEHEQIFPKPRMGRA